MDENDEKILDRVWQAFGQQQQQQQQGSKQQQQQQSDETAPLIQESIGHEKIQVVASVHKQVILI